MNVIEVEIVRAHPFQRRRARCQNVVIGKVGAVDLAGQQNILARESRDGFAHQRFGMARGVKLRRIDMGDAVCQRHLDGGDVFSIVVARIALRAPAHPPRAEPQHGQGKSKGIRFGCDRGWRQGSGFSLGVYV